jgi:uncharacterized membrane protein (DUF373 family)
MEPNKKLAIFKRFILYHLRDEAFMKLIRRVENIASKILALALVVVIFITLFDLLRLLTFDLFFTEPMWTFSTSLLKIFGLFLNVLIALELMENVTAYLRHHSIQLELVIITALTAVARKIVIFDSKVEGDIIGLAIAVLSLSISYGIVRSQNKGNGSSK